MRIGLKRGFFTHFGQAVNLCVLNSMPCPSAMYSGHSQCVQNSFLMGIVEVTFSTAPESPVNPSVAWNSNALAAARAGATWLGSAYLTNYDQVSVNLNWMQNLRCAVVCGIVFVIVK